MSTQETTVWNPMGFDPREVMPARLWRHAGATRYVIYRVAAGTVCRPNDRWMSLRHEKMVEIFGGNNRAWDDVRRSLIDARVIERDQSYVIGQRSMRYRLIDPWCNLPIEPLVIKDAALAKRIDEIEWKDSGKERFEPVHRHLESCFKRVTVDPWQSSRALASMPDEQRYRTERLLSFIGRHDSRIKLGSTGRVYTSVTSLPRTIRHSLRIDDQPLLELDIANSQPLLLGMICMHSINQALCVGEGETSLSFFHTSCRNAPIVHGCTDDVREWVNECTRGQIYECLADALKMPCSTDAERDDVKIATCRLLFGPYRPEFRSWRRFSERWPAVAGILATMKIPDYRNVARTLQRAESHLMINTVCESIRVDQPGTPILTIHDSLMVTLLTEDVAKLAIRAAWHEFGVVPRIRTKAECMH